MSSDEFEGASEWFGGKRVNPMKLKRRTRLSEKKKIIHYMKLKLFIIKSCLLTAIRTVFREINIDLLAHEFLFSKFQQTYESLL